jgi:hypothetical protein
MKAIHFLIVLVIALIGITAHNCATTKDLDERITALETAQKMSEPETAWLINAMETMYTLTFFNHNSWINNNAPLYLSKSGKAAYQKTLENLDIINEITANESVLYANINITPQQKSCSGVDFAKKDEPSSFCEYKILINLKTQSGAKMKFFGDHEFNVTVGSRYTSDKAEYTLHPKQEYLITDIVMITPQNIANPLH